MKQFLKMGRFGLTLVVLLVVVLAGCSNGNSETEKTAESGDKNKVSTEKKLPRVAFVYIGTPGDGGWTFEHDKGRLVMEEKFGIKSTVVENVPEGADAERVITDLAQNNDIVFTTSFGYMDQTLSVAEKFPKVVFLHTSGYKTADNMGNFFGKNYEASYLSGIAAGKVTKTNHLGYVGAFPIPEVIYNINAFTLGAKSVNPDVKVSVVWSNTWYDPTTERQAAISLLDQGADVLLAYQDSPATLQAAAERGALAGGNDSDMNHYAPDAYLTNPVWNWGPYYVDTVQQVIDGTWKPTSYSGSMADGMVSLAPMGKSVPEDVKKIIEETQNKIISGENKIFVGPIKDQAGAIKVEEGKTLTLEEVLSINWFVEGVQGTIPK